MPTINYTFLNKGKYQISLQKLFNGWNADTTSEESTLIREYVDYKNTYPLPKKLYFDEIASTYFEYGNIIWFCLHLLETGFKNKKIKKLEDISQIIDIDYLISVLNDEDESFEVCKKVLLKVCN